MQFQVTAPQTVYIEGLRKSLSRIVTTCEAWNKWFMSWSSGLWRREVM